jgi:hypothetical protein
MLNKKKRKIKRVIGMMRKGYKMGIGEWWIKGEEERYEWENWGMEENLIMVENVLINVRV